MSASTKHVAYSYIRMSTDGQLKGDSLRRQVELSETYAARHGLALVRDFRLHDIGISAYRGANIESGRLGQFVEAIKTGVVPSGSYLLVESLDRLSRQKVAEALGVFLEIIRSGIIIVTLVDERVYERDELNLEQLIVSLVVMSRAHEESEAKSFRLSKAWENKRAQATEKKLTGKCPAWLRLGPDRMSFQVVEDRVAVIRNIFKWSADGAGTFTIMRRLNRAAIPAFGGQAGWATSSITKILSNRAVLGEMQPHKMVDGKRQPVGAPIEGYFPVTIDEQLFLRVQGARLSRKKAGGGRRGVAQRNLFTHIAKCGRCGAPMHLFDGGRGPKGGLILRCSRSMKAAGCDAKGWPYEEFERSFLQYVREIGLADMVSSDETSGNQGIVEAIATEEARIEELRAKRDHTFNLLSSAEVGTEFVRGKLAEMATQIKAVEHKIAELRATLSSHEQVTASDDIVELLKAFQGNSEVIEERRIRLAAALRSMVAKLKVDPEREHFKSPIPFILIDPGGIVRTMSIEGSPGTSSSFVVEMVGGTERHVVVRREGKSKCVTDRVCHLGKVQLEHVAVGNFSLVFEGNPWRLRVLGNRLASSGPC